MPLMNALENLSTEAKQDDIISALGDLLTELTAKFEAGEEVALDAATLAALETINATVSGTVALDAGTLSALETINAVCSGTVALDAGTLSALENITATISGSVAVTGPLTDSQLRATAVPVAENLPGTATLNNVSASASSVTLQASNSSRRGLTIFNDSATATLYVKFGTTASTTSFTVKMVPGSYYEVPFPAYTGIVTGIWDVASGSARMTELT